MLSRRGFRQADDGAVTVEAAIAVASIVTVLMLCIGGILAVSMHVRCVDAAREAARLSARGDHEVAVTTAQRIAPSGASISVQRAGGFVTAVVSAESAVLPLVKISSQAIASVEPGVDGEPA